MSNIKTENWKETTFGGDFFWQMFCDVIHHATKLKIWMIHQAASCWCIKHGLKKGWKHFLLLFGQSKCMYMVYFCLALWHNITNKTGYWKQMSRRIFSYKFTYSHAFSNLMHFIDSRYMYPGRDHFHLYFQSFVIKTCVEALLFISDEALHVTNLFGTAH